MFFLMGNGKIVSENINSHIVFSVNHYFNLCAAVLLPVFLSVQTENTHTEITCFSF